MNIKGPNGRRYALPDAPRVSSIDKGVMTGVLPSSLLIFVKDAALAEYPTQQPNPAVGYLATKKSWYVIQKTLAAVFQPF